MTYPKLSPQKLKSVKSMISFWPQLSFQFSAWKSVQNITNQNSLIEKFYFEKMNPFTQDYKYISLLPILVFIAYLIASSFDIVPGINLSENWTFFLPCLIILLLTFMYVFKTEYYNVFIKK